MHDCRKHVAAVLLSVAFTAFVGCRTTAPQSPPTGELGRPPLPMSPGSDMLPPSLPYPEDGGSLDWLPPAEPLPPREAPPAPPGDASSNRNNSPFGGQSLDEADLFPADQSARHRSTRRDPVAEPIETQQKLVPSGLRPPRLLDRLSQPIRGIWGGSQESAAVQGRRDGGVAPTAHSAPDFVSHRSTLRFATQGSDTAGLAPPSWAAHSIAR